MTRARLDARTPREWFQRLLGALRGGRADEDLQAELRAHLELAAEDAERRGHSPEEAGRIARLRSGGTLPAVEALRERRGLPWVDDLARDFRYAIRTLGRSPAFTLVALLTLALGMGANAAVYQLVDAVRLRPLPLNEPQQLVLVRLAEGSRRPGRQGSNHPALTNAVWEHFRDHQNVLTGALAWFPGSLQLDRETAAGSVRGLFVSGEFFNVLDVRPLFGRVFTAADDRAGCGLPGAVVSHGFWRSHLGADPRAVGSSLTLNGRRVVVIGVTPREFSGLEVGRAYDVAVPICSHAILGAEPDWLGNGSMWWLTVMGRMPPGQSLDQVNAGLQALSPAIFEATLPPAYASADARAYAELTLQGVAVPGGVSILRIRYGDPLLILLVTTVLVLLIACTNLANLILARAAAREREFSVRLAIGASWGRLVRQLMVENAVLAAAGALAGLALAGVLSRVLVGFLDGGLFLDLRVDVRLVGFMLLTSVVTCLAFGLAPAWRASRVAAADAMKTGGRTVAGIRGGSRMRQSLVVAQVALSLVLVFAAAVFAATLRNLMAVDPGFRSGNVSVARINFSRLPLSPETRVTFKRDLLDRIRGLPGVSGAAEVRHVPLGGTGSALEIWRDGADPATRRGVRVNRVSDGYLRVMGIDLIAGRDFTRSEASTSGRVAIVNRSCLGLLGLADNPIGERLRIGDERDSEAFDVVGLVPDTKYFSLREAPVPAAFLPVDPAGDLRPFTDLMIASSLPAGQVQTAVRRALPDISSTLGADVRPYGDTIRNRIGPERLMAALTTFFGGLSILIAAIGLYGVMSYVVTRRTTEIGVRIALGAGRRTIVLMVLREAAAVLTAGLVIGSFLTLAVADAARSLVFGVQPRDASTLVLACLLLATVALVASALPAWRAAKVDPLDALRGS